MKYQKKNELKHYGILGMKWGVRKDSYSSSRRYRQLDSDKGVSGVNKSIETHAYALSTHRKNNNIKKIKNDYKEGKITKKDKKQKIKNEKEIQKNTMRKTDAYLKNKKVSDKEKYATSKKLIDESYRKIGRDKIKKMQSNDSFLSTSIVVSSAGGMAIGGPTAAALSTTLSYGRYKLADWRISKQL